MYYEELSPIVFAVIYNRLLRSERLVRLLTCYKRNTSPYLDKSFDEEIERIGGLNNLVYMGQNLDKCTDVHIYPLEHLAPFEAPSNDSRIKFLPIVSVYLWRQQSIS